MWCHWHQCWHHMVPMALIRHNFIPYIKRIGSEEQLGHVMPLPLVSVSHDADSIINGTIPFLMSKWLKWSGASLFGHVLPLVLTYASCDADGINNSTIAFVRSMWLKWGATWFSCHFKPLALMLASHDAVSIGKGTITFLTSRQSKWGVTWFFIMWQNGHWHHMMSSVLVPHATGISVSATWCLQHHKWHHYILRSSC